jgi:hypothetical protein
MRAEAVARVRAVDRSLLRSPPGTGRLEECLASDIRRLTDALRGAPPAGPAGSGHGQRPVGVGGQPGADGPGPTAPQGSARPGPGAFAANVASVQNVLTVLKRPGQLPDLLDGDAAEMPGVCG